jgi:hypothetical protein
MRMGNSVARVANNTFSAVVQKHLKMLLKHAVATA